MAVADIAAPFPLNFMEEMEILFRAFEVGMNIFPPLRVFCPSLAHWGGWLMSNTTGDYTLYDARNRL